MKYDILSVLITRTPQGLFETSVAWQSNEAGAWRVTVDALSTPWREIPSQIKILQVMKTGFSLDVARAVERFPHLPKDCVED